MAIVILREEIFEVLPEILNIIKARFPDLKQISDNEYKFKLRGMSPEQHVELFFKEVNGRYKVSGICKA